MTENDPNDDLRLLRNEAASRFEVWLGETRAGFSEYDESDSHVTFIHTVIDDAFGGRGLGGQLVEFALRDVIGRGKRVVPRCSFFRGYLRKHHGFDEHVDLPVSRTP